MKRFAAILICLAMVFAFTSCGEKPDPEPQQPDLNAKSEGVMSYEDYATALAESAVTIEAYVQAVYPCEDGTLNLFLQDLSGGYYVEALPCSEEDAALLTPAKKIKVSGTKAEERGEIKLLGTEFSFADELEYLAAPADVTALLDTDAMILYQNRYVLFQDMELVSEAVFRWDNSGEDGDDLYFQVGKDGQVFTFMVSAALSGSGTQTYEAVKALKAGDTVDLEGFCFWVDGLTPLITSVTVK